MLLIALRILLLGGSDIWEYLVKAKPKSVYNTVNIHIRLRFISLICFLNITKNHTFDELKFNENIFTVYSNAIAFSSPRHYRRFATTGSYTDVYSVKYDLLRGHLKK